MRKQTLKIGTIRIDSAFNLHLIDLVAALFERNRDLAGATVRKWLKKGTFLESEFVLKDQVRLVPFKLLFKFMMRMPGILGDRSREEFSRVLHLYVAGDDRLRKEVQNNAASSDFIHVAAREALGADSEAAAGQGQEQHGNNTGDILPSVSPSILCQHLCLSIRSSPHSKMLPHHPFLGRTPRRRRRRCYHISCECPQHPRWRSWQR